MMKSLLSSVNVKRIAVYGAGAVGSFFGSFFLKAGFDVEFIARGKSLDVLVNDGLKVILKSDETFFKVKTRSALEGAYDIILVCVKSQDTKSVAEACVGHLSHNGYVVSLQNGVENPSILTSYLGSDKVIPAAIYLTASIVRAGVVKSMSRGQILFGSYDLKNVTCVDDFESVLSKTDIPNERVENIKLEQWKKFMLNVTYNPLSALFMKTYGDLAENDLIIKLAKDIFDEAREAAAIIGVNIEESYFEVINEKCKANPKFKTSMLQDIEANKHPEIDAMLGAVVRIFEHHGKKASTCETILNIMQVKFGGWFQISPRLASDVLVGYADKILLIERKNEPKGWAIPGGMVDLYESMELAAVRELEEETGVKASVEDVELLGIYSDPGRDTRGHTVSAVYVYQVNEEPIVKGADDAINAKFFKLSELPLDIAFDHRKIIDEYREKYKNHKY